MNTQSSGSKTSSSTVTHRAITTHTCVGKNVSCCMRAAAHFEDCSTGAARQQLQPRSRRRNTVQQTLSAQTTGCIAPNHASAAGTVHCCTQPTCKQFLLTAQLAVHLPVQLVRYEGLQHPPEHAGSETMSTWTHGETLLKELMHPEGLQHSPDHAASLKKPHMVDAAGSAQAAADMYMPQCMLVHDSLKQV